ncbi:MAG: type II secretion system protein [Holophagaceae bacterium]|nr:type II secretion system protein [Holophagaceae bacterium]
MSSHSRSRGFSLIELLLALSIIGILSAIAIPAFSTAREHARYIGDAKANTKIIMMQLEGVKSDTGLYPAAGGYTWTQGVPDAAALGVLPSLKFKDGTKLDYTVTVAASRLTYVVVATDPAKSNKTIYKVDQTGAIQ